MQAKSQVIARSGSRMPGSVRDDLWRVGVILTLCSALGSCSGGGSGSVTPPPPPATQSLTAADVTIIVQAAATVAQSDDMVIAVVDRLGRVLAVYKGMSAPAMLPGNFGTVIPSDELAVNLARTGAFFSNDQAPLSSRTVRYISGIHFPPGVMNAASADLYGIENTNRGCLNNEFAPGQFSPQGKLSDGSGLGLGILTGKADMFDSQATAVNPGGVPLFKGGEAVGGVGVAADSMDVAAFAGGVQSKFLAPPALPPPGAVVIGGITVPFVLNSSQPAGTSTGSADGS